MASVSDKITKTMQGSNPNVARVVSPRAAGSDTLQVDSLSGWNEDTATHFMSYRVDSAGKVVAGSQRDWKGIAKRRAALCRGAPAPLRGQDRPDSAA